MEALYSELFGSCSVMTSDVFLLLPVGLWNWQQSDVNSPCKCVLTRSCFLESFPFFFRLKNTLLRFVDKDNDILYYTPCSYIPSLLSNLHPFSCATCLLFQHWCAYFSPQRDHQLTSNFTQFPGREFNTPFALYSQSLILDQLPFRRNL